MSQIEVYYDRVLEKNTFWFFNADFEERYDTQHLYALTTLLLNLQAEIQQKNGLITKAILHEFLQEENGLRAILALNGLSNEQLKRIITLARVIQKPSLDKLLLRDQWSKQDNKPVEEGVSEWGTQTIEKLTLNDAAFREGLINLFFKGGADPILSRTMKPFEIRKLSIDKLSFKIEAMIDTLVRYKEHGSYSGMKQNNPEITVREILESLDVTWYEGDLDTLVEETPIEKRKMDFVIPTRENPLVIAESSYLATTSSGQGDKSKTEISIKNLLAEHYPNAKFIGFIDGIGWYVRKNDLKRMVSAYDDVFTFDKDELDRFRQLIIEELNL